MLLALARVWAYPLWCSVTRSESADAVAEDVDWWMRCIDDADLLALDRYSRFAYLSGALTEFRTLVHYRLRSAPLALRLLLRAIYRPAATLTLNADRIGPGLFIQHGVATIVTAKSIGSHCWINQQVTIGHDATGRPTLRRSRPGRSRRGGDRPDHLARRGDGRSQRDGDPRRRTRRNRGGTVGHPAQSSARGRRRTSLGTQSRLGRTCAAKIASADTYTTPTASNRSPPRTRLFSSEDTRFGSDSFDVILLALGSAGPHQRNRPRRSPLYVVSKPPCA